MRQMFKRALLTLSLAVASVSAFAGGYLTNTNQSVAFLRNPAQHAVIGIQGAYSNPAGIGFMAEGWHFGVNAQTTWQKRITNTTYGPFAYGDGNNGSTKKFTGNAFVPINPSIDAAYVKGKWFGSFHFGIVSGGGKAEYDDGIASFETPVAALGAILVGASSGAISGYAADIDLTGQQYNYAGQISIGYRLNDHWSVSVGLRMNYVKNTYEGGLRNIQVNYGGTLLAASDVFSLFGLSSFSSLVEDKELDCVQTDLAWTPIIGVDFKTGKWNFAARYEFNTKVRLENDTDVNTTGIAQYDDEAVIANDIPALLTLGAQFSPFEKWRISAGWNMYFDKQANQYNSATGENDKTDYLDNNTWEANAGVEYDLSKLVTLSTGINYSKYDAGTDGQYLSDISFNTTSFNWGLGARFHLSDKVAIDVAWYHSFYSKYTKKQSDYGGYGATYTALISSYASQLAALGMDVSSLSSADFSGSDQFTRKNDVIAIGLILDL